MVSFFLKTETKALTTLGSLFQSLSLSLDSLVGQNFYAHEEEYKLKHVKYKKELIYWCQPLHVQQHTVNKIQMLSYLIYLGVSTIARPLLDFIFLNVKNIILKHFS